MTKPRMAKNLAVVDEIPAEITSRLQGHVGLLQRIEHSEEFFAQEPLAEIVYELDSICESDGIVGVHYARADRKLISSEGLLPRTGAERRAQFLKSNGHRFTAAQRERLCAAWASYFTVEQNRIRDGRIWFNLTRMAMSNGGAEPLLSNYGGEVIYVPFSRDEEIYRILRGFGESIIVECSLQTESVRTFCEKPWGRTWLSSYHCSVNPKAFQWDVDLYTEEPVPPDAIVKIEVL